MVSGYFEVIILKLVSSPCMWVKLGKREYGISRDDIGFLESTYSPIRSLSDSLMFPATRTTLPTQKCFKYLTRNSIFSESP